jgi:hypothetical protein
MSQKDHCNLCDQVIESDVQRLTLTAGVATGDVGSQLNAPFDICPACVKGNTVLQQLMNEAKAS